MARFRPLTLFTADPVLREVENGNTVLVPDLLDIYDPGGGADDKTMRLEVTGGILKLKSLTDAGADLLDNIATFDLGAGSAYLLENLTLQEAAYDVREKISLIKSESNPASITSLFKVVGNARYSGAFDAYYYGLNINVRPTIALYGANTYDVRGITLNVLRNADSGAADDDGTLASIQGIRLNYGNSNTLGAESPQTTEAMGYYVRGNFRTGLVATAYDLYLAPRIGTLVTTHWGIYQAQSTAHNYLAGNLAIGGTTFGTDLVNGQVFFLGTEPTTRPVNSVQMCGVDQAPGNTCLQITTENGAEILLFQGAAIADVGAAYAAGSLDTEEEIRAAINAQGTAINSILARLRADGLIAT